MNSEYTKKLKDEQNVTTMTKTSKLPQKLTKENNALQILIWLS